MDRMMSLFISTKQSLILQSKHVGGFDLTNNYLDIPSLGKVAGYYILGSNIQRKRDSAV
jgi:hypothetical protein